ncbi:MAG: hypothetical protein KGH53_03835 [Candidatus Micrarchaeota archaeon]|nr:hypothetical protein [Candidatus Micrarchaeota archaeon]
MKDATKTKLTNSQITDLFISAYKEKGSISEAQTFLLKEYGIRLGNHPSRDKYTPRITTAAHDLLRKKSETQASGVLVTKGARTGQWKKDDWIMVYEQKLMIKALRELGMSDEDISRKTGWSLKFVAQQPNKEESADVDAFKMFGGKEGSKSED